MVRTVGNAFELFYLVSQLAGLVGVTVILHRLRFAIATALAPLATVLVVALILQALAVATWPGLHLFAFGLVAALNPAMALVPPVFVAFLAISPRLTQPPAKATSHADANVSDE